MTNKTSEITNAEDLIDLRDVIARYEDLESDCEDYDPASDSEEPENYDEYKSLKALLEECKGNGGDEQWRGDWYPVGLIRDSYFEEYARDMAEDIGAISADDKWPCTCIDWERAARELQMDYTMIDFDGVDYWVR